MDNLIEIYLLGFIVVFIYTTFKSVLVLIIKKKSIPRYLWAGILTLSILSWIGAIIIIADELYKGFKK